ncbi:class II glutamine amidotransferase [Nocardioides sp. cx-169]|uniref:class II glutamine amidotransferase n=1 Tax=Nocardioides sp. cx-169 TaxID=2899080 RepID=UPI0022AC7576|nr:class II glutamine amidotransferase [Nocardioides sp. cx-169]
MCRLFGMHAGRTPRRATFWLLSAPDSLAEQSHRMPDGTGLGAFGLDGRPVLDKQPLAAYDDPAFATEAKDLASTTFVAHVRYATTGPVGPENTHPFEQDGRLLAHNGVVEDLDRLEDRLRELGGMSLVQGQTDSERVFALITAEARRNGGDVGAAITAALTWTADNLTLYAVNLILTTPTELWAVRYPDTHELHVLELPGRGGLDPLSHATDRISTRSEELGGQRGVVVASEPMTDDPGWRLMDSGEVLHVGPDLDVHSSRPLPAHPSHLEAVGDLDRDTALAQHPGGHEGKAAAQPHHD